MNGQPGPVMTATFNEERLFYIQHGRAQRTAEGSPQKDGKRWWMSGSPTPRGLRALGSVPVCCSDCSHRDTK